MTRRLALLIGNTTFEDTEAFPDLQTPANNVHDLAVVLKEYGKFEILDTLVDATALSICQTIEDLFVQAGRGDRILL